MSNTLSSLNKKIFKCVLIYIGIMAVAPFSDKAYAQAQVIPEAESEPRSILFPSGVAGPYFPSDDEIVVRAEERLNNADSVINDENPELTGIDTDIEIEIEDKSIFGILSEDDGGFSKSIWSRSTYDKIASLLEVLKLPIKSPAMDDISKKLLLSLAAAPTGKTDAPLEVTEINRVSELIPTNGYDEEALTKFINLRVSKLIERGNLSDVVSFIQNMSEQQLEINKRNAEILMLGGDIIGACQMTDLAKSSEIETDAIFWQKMQTFCLVLEADNTGAQIALDLLNENSNIDFVFFDLISILMEDPAVRPNFISRGLTTLEPLNYTILSLLDQPIEAQLIESSSPLVLSALVINPNMSIDNRFQAAVKSYLSGGISVDVLSDIYDLQEFSAPELDNALMMVSNDDRPLADALLYQAASKQIIDIDKAEILNEIWTRALLTNDLPRKAKLNINTLLSLTPNDRLINHAHHITRGLLLGGEIDKATEWYDFIRRSAVSGDAESTRALINIWPLVLLASDKGEIPWTEDIIELWWNGQMVLAPESRDSKAVLFYAIAEAFQYEVSEDKWLELITEKQAENRHSIPLGVWRDLMKSIGEDKGAQSIILSLIAMSPDGPGKLDASGISVIIRTLRSFGLEKEARNIAIEAMSANEF
ncbi:MAG: hypothetical protein HOH19_12080 [Kordiimonadaceae bacterium]|jgi:hypothetical protein|nr:hypothetical protein [Kordiimonadaceae bacterium]MBT6033307.1 hypothetical protein [Kordiimonadaceae bacterium]